MAERRARLSRVLVTLTFGAGMVAISSPVAAAPAGTISRVSVASDGTQGTGDTYSDISMSADGRYVAFASSARNLVPDDTNAFPDVFVHDRKLGTTRRVSVASDGTQLQGGGTSVAPSISADGRYVAFASNAPDLVPGDNNGNTDVFVHDLQTGMTTRVNVNAIGASGPDTYDMVKPSISSDGRYVAFVSEASDIVPADTNNQFDVFVRDLQLGVTTRVSVSSTGAQANQQSKSPSMSADGRYVAFTSGASNLVPGDNAGGVFVHDLQAATTRRLGAGSLPSISADGRYVAFTSDATNLVPGDTNGESDVFVHDLQAEATTRISVASDGSQAVGASQSPRFGAISADNRFVIFESRAYNLVSQDTNGGFDVFVRDLGTSTTTRVSVAGDGRQASAGGLNPQWTSLSADGRYAAFISAAADLVPGDTNGYRDVFVRTMALPAVTSVTPSNLTAGASDVTVELMGSDFTATPSLAMGPGISVNSMTFVSSSNLRATLTVAAGAAAGPRDVVVTNPAGDSASCGGCFIVQPPPPPARSGYWMVGSDGAVYAFGDARRLENAPTASAVDLEPTSSGNGYWMVDDLGRVFAFGDAVHRGNVDTSRLAVGERVTSISSTSSGTGYWVFTTRGRVLTFGDAVFQGDVSGLRLNGPVLDSIPTPSGQGYYMVASDGGIFAFGDAKFHGSMGGKPLNKPVQSLVPDGDGIGYWLVASDGGIFAFGAPFRGSMGGKALNKPVTGMVRFGNGYLMVGEDGGIFNFSDKGFFGSLGDRPPARPIVSVAVLEG